MKTVIGLTGAFGSGCTKIAETFICPMGYSYISLSQILREEYRRSNGELGEEAPRSVLQDFGDEQRRTKGNAYFAVKAIEQIIGMEEDLIIVDSIRNPHEVQELRRAFINFYLIGVFADSHIRWNRVKDKYRNNSAEFEKDEKRDKGENDKPYGQGVTECFLNSDLIISNNKEIIGENIAYREMSTKCGKYINLLNNPYSQLPNDDETLMSIAFANSQRSSCLKRRVGAIIVKSGNIIGSGYNEVPSLPAQNTCNEKYNGCYRDKHRRDLKNEIVREQGVTTEQADQLIDKIKVLEKCRSLHAEENAIINIARFGNSAVLKDSVLYTTTFPCNLCANKIVQTQISRIVYFEPYPVIEAKEILDGANILQSPFEGITFKSYFRVFGKIQM